MTDHRDAIPVHVYVLAILAIGLAYGALAFAGWVANLPSTEPM